MGVFLKLVSHDQGLRESKTVPVILNDLPTITKDNRQHIDRLICTVYHGTDLFSNEPSCECPSDEGLKGGYLKGVICNNCGQAVKDRFEQVLEPLVWMRRPGIGTGEEVAKLINPMVWTMLDLHFTLKKVKKRPTDFSIIEWLTNTDYTVSHRPAEIEELLAMGVKRGYNNFVNNFDDYVAKLFSLRTFAKGQRGVMAYAARGIPTLGKVGGRKESALQVLLREQRDCVFSDYLPMPNKALLVIEETRAGTTYVDPVLVGAVNAIRTISAIDDPSAMLTLRQKENRVAKTLAALSAFYYAVNDKIMAGKPGLYRKHVMAFRGGLSTRSVISSRTRPHRYDTLEMSWGQGVTLLQVHLQNKLQRLGYTPNEARSILQGHTTEYDPLLDRLLKELISESEDGVLWGTYIRNPSLGRGSAQRLGVSAFKTDVGDPTTGLSILDVNQYNADFDGKMVAVVKLL